LKDTWAKNGSPAVTALLMKVFTPLADDVGRVVGLSAAVRDFDAVLDERVVEVLGIDEGLPVAPSGRDVGGPVPQRGIPVHVLAEEAGAVAMALQERADGLGIEKSSARL
jgi:hypothetical protein